MQKQIDFTKGSIIKHIFSLSLPTMIAFALNTSFNIVDTIFVGRLGTDAIAAVSIVFPMIILMIALGSGVGIGAASLIARYLGAKKIKEAGKVAEHTLIISLVLAVIFAIFGLLFSEKLFLLIGASPNVVSLAMDYSKWIFGFGGFMFVFIAFSNVLRGEGDAKTPMKCMISSTLLNAALDPLLIFGIWFFPALGIQGAAISTVIARAFGCILIVVYVLKGKSLVKISLKHFKYSYKIVKGIFAVGIPSSLSMILMSAGMLVITAIISSFGPSAIAAYGIGFKLESIAFHFAIGIAIATIAIVGHNFGAGKIQRAKKAALIASGMSMVAGMLIGFILLIAPTFWFGLFTKDALVLTQGVSFIKVMAWFFGFTGLGIVIESAFQGFGKGMPKFVLTVLRIGLLGIPLAYILSKNFGFVGVWYGVAIGSFVSSLIGLAWFMLSRFKQE